MFLKVEKQIQKLSKIGVGPQFGNLYYFFLEFGSAGFLKVEKKLQNIIKNRCWALVWLFLGLNLMYAMSKLDINFVCTPPRYTVASTIPPSVYKGPWCLCYRNYMKDHSPTRQDSWRLMIGGHGSSTRQRTDCATSRWT